MHGYIDSRESIWVHVCRNLFEFLICVLFLLGCCYIQFDVCLNVYGIMDSEDATPSTSLVNCFDCGCSCLLVNQSYSGPWLRSVKRKFHEFGEGNRVLIPGFNPPHVARVETENEHDALREMVNSQQKNIEDLLLELEEERNASSSAANEAMSMILRLQREKAEIQMEAWQFKRFVEEKIAHNQQELSTMEDLLYKREQAIESLYCEVWAYKHRMMNFGLTESEVDGDRGSMTRNNSVAGDLDAQCELATYNYPRLKCGLSESQVPLVVDNDVTDVEKCVFGETPHSQDHLKDLSNAGLTNWRELLEKFSKMLQKMCLKRSQLVILLGILDILGDSPLIVPIHYWQQLKKWLQILPLSCQGLVTVPGRWNTSRQRTTQIWERWIVHLKLEMT